MDEQNKNLILATVLSGLVILVWLVFFPPEQPVEPIPNTDITATTGSSSPQNQVAQTPSAGPVSGSSANGQTATGPTLNTSPAETRVAALAKTKRVVIDTPRLKGSLSLKGGRIDDLSLKDYRLTTDPKSANVTLLSPVGSPTPYYALYGWAPVGDLGFEDVPGALTEWQVDSGDTLTVQTPVTLRWKNGKGLIFYRKISVDDNYMFTVEQSVTNNSGSEVKLSPYGIIARHGEPSVIGFYILHEGVVQASDGKLEETKYKDVKKLDPFETGVGEKIPVKSNGWIGFTDKYWMTTLIAGKGQKFDEVTKYSPKQTIYQTDMRLPIISVAAGSSGSVSTLLFAGAKEWETIRNYQDNLGIAQFVDSIDWGIFFFLTKPIFQVLHFMNNLFGNMGIAIISLTVLIKALLFPLAYKSYVSMARMKELQPEIEKMKAKVGDDRQKTQQEMMKMYKEKKVNPASGCLPILLQIPIFFSLYKVIFVTIELRQAPFFGWIKDLSIPDPTSVLNLFGLLPFSPPDPSSALNILSIGVFPVLMGISMWLQQKLNPAPTDKTQAKIFALMPWVFMFMLGRFASGLVVYWVANNTITFTQQYLIMRSQGIKPDVFGNILKSFRRKAKAKE
ncbi:MAG: membrane protein insertase YidC [Alphaproteobacteria bacterium]|nr:membrane protein insertase YidC [Alphaproteobacteria bacterium]